MSNYAVPGMQPPSWVPGPYQEPDTPSKYMRPQTQPNWRVVDIPVVSTLAEIALRYYRNPQEAWRIFNDNRAGTRMPDGTDGALDNPNQALTPGTRIWLS